MIRLWHRHQTTSAHILTRRPNRALFPRPCVSLLCHFSDNALKKLAILRCHITRNERANPLESFILHPGRDTAKV